MAISPQIAHVVTWINVPYKYCDLMEIPWCISMKFFVQNQSRSMSAALVGCERGSKCEGLFNQMPKTLSRILVVPPDPFQRMGVRRSSTEAQQSDHAPRSGPEINNRRNSAKNGTPERLRCRTIQKEVSYVADDVHMRCIILPTEYIPLSMH